MTSRDLFREMMRRRRGVRPGTPDHEWMTRAARKYLWLARGIPTTEWTQ